MAFTKPSALSGTASGGSEYFDPRKYAGAYAMLFEPTELRTDVPKTNFKPSESPVRDEIKARITVFMTRAELASQTPHVDENMTVTATYLVNLFRQAIGEQVAGVTFKGDKGAWLLNDLDGDTEDLLVDYVADRENSGSDESGDDEDFGF